MLRKDKEYLPPAHRSDFQGQECQERSASEEQTVSVLFSKKNLFRKFVGVFQKGPSPEVFQRHRANPFQADQDSAWYRRQHEPKLNFERFLGLKI